MHKHESMSRCKYCVKDAEAQEIQPWVVHRVLDFLQDIDTAHDGYMANPEGRSLEVALENYGDKPEFKSGDAALAGIKKRLWDAYVTLRKASIYAQRVEWWQSGDDGSLDFIGRTDEELEALKKELEPQSPACKED